jgi:3-isopropylmalate/(R)-2-methylmalate dehydratase small subunit
MEKYVTLSAIAAPIMRVNIDTDIIIPSREMKQVSKKGLSNGLFAGWRYLDMETRQPDPGFILNNPAYFGTQILLAGENFGCGSSREHAVWALAEYGIRVIIAPSFNSIFLGNCIQNGLLPIVLPKAEVHNLAKHAVSGSKGIFTVDLENQIVTSPNNETLPFYIPANHKQALMEGLDLIDQTMQMQTEIEAFEQKRFSIHPWAALT